MQQPPGHGAHPVEEGQGLSGASGVDRSRSQQKPEVGVDLLGGGIGDPESGFVLQHFAVTGLVRTCGSPRWLARA
jgi:hypothetical protein